MRHICRAAKLIAKRSKLLPRLSNRKKVSVKIRTIPVESAVAHGNSNCFGFSSYGEDAHEIDILTDFNKIFYVIIVIFARE